MGYLMAFVAGYVIGGRGGKEGFDDVVDALHDVASSQEVQDLVKALRSHASHMFQELGTMLAVDVDEPLSMTTILERARNLVQNDDSQGRN
jgi:hypothetical protein